MCVVRDVEELAVGGRWEEEVSGVWLCGSGRGPATGPENSKHTRTSTQRVDTENTPIVTYLHKHTHLSVVVEVPQV